MHVVDSIYQCPLKLYVYAMILVNWSWYLNHI